ncbi:MAG: efflux RND transporter permease subunit, partial [Proteobacteria bacterium]|nr:efflux RND transporter permease subunit [Pseudomonadota bacterium]
MFDIARWSIERPLYPWIIVFCCIAAGWYGINTVGRLEDPVFDFGMAVVVTPYPGASAEEVEHEVTDVIESAIQELPYLEILTSQSVPGRSEIRLQVYPQYMGDRLPQVWDEMRRRVGEARYRLPPGAGPVIVEDDFGDVFGILYAVKAAGYSPAQTRDIANSLVRHLKLVHGVARVGITGLPEEAIFVELDRERLARMGLPVEQIFASISVENQVLGAGSISVADRRIRIRPPPSFESVQAVADLQVGLPGSTEIIRLGDIANIVREPVENPTQIVRHQGETAFTVGVSVVREMNVVDVGNHVDQAVAELNTELPIGVTLEPIYRQHKVVSRSIDDFFTNLGISIATVIGALCLFMGWRAGTVVGSILFLTIFGTIGGMAFFGIELQRISLGALMIAMGMLVDNAIVVAEGMVVGTRQGLSPEEAASRSVKRTQYALLGATVIGILAFAPIGLSDDESGKFLRSLIQVVSI